MHSVSAAAASASASASAAVVAACCRRPLSSLGPAVAVSAATSVPTSNRGRRPTQAPVRHISRSRRADSPPSVTPHHGGGGHGLGQEEAVLHLLSTLKSRLPSSSSSSSSPSSHSLSPPALGSSPFPSTTSSVGLGRQPLPPSFTPASSPLPSVPTSTSSFLPSPPPMPRTAQALHKLQAVDLTLPGPVPATATADLSLSSAMGSFGVAGLPPQPHPLAAPSSNTLHRGPPKVDLSFLEQVLESNPSEPPGSPAPPAAAAADTTGEPLSTLSAATDADWTALLSAAAAASAPAASTSSTTKPTAPNQLPDLSHLTSHLQAVRARSAAQSPRLSLLARLPGPASSPAAPVLPPRLSTDDLTALRFHLHSASSSPLHLRAYLATLLTHLPLPPAALVADALAAAARLGHPGLAHALVAHIRASHGLLGLVTCLSPTAFEHLVRLAWDHERSMPRVGKWVRDMVHLGIKPSPGLATYLDTLLTKCSAPAAIEAQVGQGAGAATPVQLPAERVPSEREANWLWTVLCEANWTRYLAAARVSLDKAAHSGSLVRGHRGRPSLDVPGAQAAAAAPTCSKVAREDAGPSPLFSSASLAELVRSAATSPDAELLVKRGSRDQAHA